MTRAVFVAFLVSVAILVAKQASGARDITRTLGLKLTLNKQKLRVGEEITGQFRITNISKKDVSVVTVGALYMAYWFGIEGGEGRVLAEPLFEKLFTDYISNEDIVTLKPGQSFTVDRKAKLKRSAKRSGKAFLVFDDSAFELHCGKRYRVYGRFWAREDRSGTFKVISGDLRSPAIRVSIARCD